MINSFWRTKYILYDVVTIYLKSIYTKILVGFKMSKANNSLKDLNVLKQIIP